MESKREIIVVGGGAAGLTAAIFAAKHGAKVILLEQNDRLGKKIAVTGNGRCNLTNIDMRAEVYHCVDKEFVSKVLSQFSFEDTLQFFNKIGITTTDKNGWIYPRSMQAKSVPELLERYARSLKVKIKTREKVTDIKIIEERWAVYTETWHYDGDAVILANGSKASSLDGADGSGYVLAKKLGHNLIKPLPSLVGLKCKNQNSWKSWAGLRVPASVTLYIDGAKSCEDSGEVQLTEYGISGIPVFGISHDAVRALEENKQVIVKIDFCQEYESSDLKSILNSRRNLPGITSDADALKGFLPDKLIPIILKHKDNVKALKEFTLEVTGNTGYEQAQVCSGGVNITEINPVTMESKRNQGIYFAGEIVDVDGPCGGYNLQWAWSSGAVAGLSSAL